jgi:hypothetical protein
VLRNRKASDEDRLTLEFPTGERHFKSYSPLESYLCSESLTQSLVANTTRANTMAASKDINESALCLQVGKLSGSQRGR